MAAAELPTHWAMSLRADGRTSPDVLREVVSKVKRGKTYLAEVSFLDVPDLTVGNLDTVLLMSEELENIDSTVEAILSRVERQLVAATVASSRGGGGGAAAAAGASGGAAAGGRSEEEVALAVHGFEVVEFVRRKYRWDDAAWDPREPLPALARRLRQAAEGVELDLDRYSTSYSERLSHQQELLRSSKGSLQTVALEAVLTRSILEEAHADVVDTPYLCTLFVVVRQEKEAEFVASYESLDAEAVPVGPEEDRDAERISPVVPRSAKRLMADGEGFVLYCMTVLRKFKDTVKTAAKSRRFDAREVAVDFDRSSGHASALAEAEVAVHSSLAELQTQCTRLYSECFALRMHVKATRLFVESVLQYGLPSDYIYCVVRPKAGQADAVRGMLARAYAHLDEFGDLGEDPDEPPLPGRVPGLPFVCLGFDVREAVRVGAA